MSDGNTYKKLSDDELRRAYRMSGGDLAKENSDALAAEIKRRNLDV